MILQRYTGVSKYKTKEDITEEEFAMLKYIKVTVFCKKGHPKPLVQTEKSICDIYSKQTCNILKTYNVCLQINKKDGTSIEN